jgi:hypothetical protein
MSGPAWRSMLRQGQAIKIAWHHFVEPRFAPSVGSAPLDPPPLRQSAGYLVLRRCCAER